MTKRHALLAFAWLYLGVPFYGGAQQPRLVLPFGHTSSISTVQYSPDGKYIMTTARFDKAVLIWEASTGKLIHSLTGHESHVSSARYSPDGKQVISAAGNVATVWDLSSGKSVHTLSGHDKDVVAEYSPTGKYILTRSWSENGIKLWDASTGALLHTMEGPDHTRSTLFSPDGTLILSSAYRDNSVKVWETSSGKLLYSLEHDGVIESFQCSVDGKYLVTFADEDNTAKIWELSSGKLLHVLKGYRDAAYISSTVFSPDGKLLFTSSAGDRTGRLWDVSTGKQVHLLIGHRDMIRGAQFSPDGNQLLTYSYEGNKALVWEVSTGKVLHTLTGGPAPREGAFRLANYSADGKFIISITLDDTTRVWDATSGKLLYAVRENLAHVRQSPDGQSMVVVAYDDNKATIREISTGKPLQSLVGRSPGITSTVYSPDGNFIMSSSSDYNTTKVWDALTGRMVHSLEGASGEYSPDSKIIVTSSTGRAIIWNASSGEMVGTLDHPSIWSVGFSPDGRQVVTTSAEGVIKVWDWTSGKELHTLRGKAARYSADGKFIVTTSNNYATIWDAVSGEALRDLDVAQLMLSSAARFGPNGKYVVATEYLAGVIAVCDASTGEALYWLRGRRFDFSPDGRYIATGGNNDNLAHIWDISSGKLHKSLQGHTQDVTGLRYSPDGKQIITVGGTAKLWDTATGKELRTLNVDGAIMTIDPSWTTMISEQNSKLSIHNLNTGDEMLTWIRVDSADWVMTSPSGLFDASPGAMDKLYFVQGFDVIEFSQLKERYYEPGLWKKIITGESLRDVTGMRSIALPPEVRVGKVDDKGYLPIELINRGGGIGEITIYIQGKEVTRDAREEDANPDAERMLIRYYVANHKNLVEGENLIAVKAWNKDHWVESRGEIVSYNKGQQKQFKPSAHIVTCGVSDYAGGKEIDLTYAAKDAEDMGKALSLGASKLFGTDKSYLYNLTTLQPREQWPTKANIIKVFEKIASVAHPMDVIVVYLSGHGISIGGAEGDFHYLTQDAYTMNPDAYADPAIREQTTLSSNELVELLKDNAVSKQVLIIDACASGKVVDNLIAKRDVPSSTLRALDRMKDRVGLHIITGCTADAVSYEASKYGQGVLTYSLLEGIRGAALREEEFVDVYRLFQYAQDRVPTLAEGIGGIQRPMVFSPSGAQSFDIGQLTANEKKKVPISKIRPVYIQSNFQDEDEMADILGLGAKVDQMLNETAARGADAPLIFVPVRQYPDGCQLVGRYERQGEKITLRLRQRCEGIDRTLELSGADLEELGGKVIDVVKRN